MGYVTYTGMLDMRARLHIRAMLHMRAFSFYCSGGLWNCFLLFIKVVRNKNLKNLIIYNFFSYHLMVMKLSTVIEPHIKISTV